MGLLFDLLLEYILLKTTSAITEKDQAKFDEFIEILMKIFENKIFPVHKLNFM